MKRVQLPNIRKLFIPDPGMVICDADLSGADAQVVAWEAEDADLKQAFRAGLRIHDKNARDMFGDEYSSASPQRQEALYKQCKAAVHATNYGASSRTVAISQGWTIARAGAFQAQWFALHPAIRAWHRRIEHDLTTTRRVVNKFGFSHTFFDRPSSVFPEALAYIPQSSVAIVCFKGALAVRAAHPWVQFLIQVHDSLVFQIPASRVGDLNLVLATLHVPIPYDDPLIIPWEIKTSDKSWGEVE